MSKFELYVVAWKEVVKPAKYSYDRDETVRQDISQEEIYEAITKYLLVKGYKATVVSVADNNGLAGEVGYE